MRKRQPAGIGVDSNYDLRNATPADAAAVERLLGASYPRLMASAYDEQVLAPALQLITKANPALLASGTYYVAERGAGQLVGCGGWTRERPGSGTIEPGIGHLRHFAVHPDWARRGIGRAIFRVCEHEAREAGVEVFECYSSLNAECFYLGLDFVRIREINMELRPPVVLRGVLLRRSLCEP